MKRVRFSLDGRTLATCSDKGRVRLWDLNAPDQIRVIRDDCSGRLAFTRAGLLMHESFSGNLYEAKVKSGLMSVAFTHPGYSSARCLALDHDFALFGVRRWDEPGHLEFWSWRDAQRLWQTEDPLPDFPMAAAVAPDGKTMATARAPAAIDS